VELFKAVAGGCRVGEVVEVARLGLEHVEAFLDVGTVGVDRRDASFSMFDALGGVVGSAAGNVPVAEAGVGGFPHRGPQVGAELVFDGSDPFGVGLPGGAGGIR
jgi:hypothetical protein